MKIQHFTATPPEAAPEAPGVSIRWVITAKDGAPNFAMRVFDVQPGAASPRHQHAWEHEVFILEGKGVVRDEAGDTPVEAGYVVLVKPGEMHQFVNTGEGLLRFICLIPHQQP